MFKSWASRCSPNEAQIADWELPLQQITVLAMNAV